LNLFFSHGTSTLLQNSKDTQSRRTVWPVKQARNIELSTPLCKEGSIEYLRFFIVDYPKICTMNELISVYLPFLKLDGQLYSIWASPWSCYISWLCALGVEESHFEIQSIWRLKCWLKTMQLCAFFQDRIGGKKNEYHSHMNAQNVT
jgi:hypothetical protein